MYNKVIMMGRIADDPEIKTTPDGHSVCPFRIAAGRRFKSGGERQTDLIKEQAGAGCIVVPEWGGYAVCGGFGKAENG